MKCIQFWSAPIVHKQIIWIERNHIDYNLIVYGCDYFDQQFCMKVLSARLFWMFLFPSCNSFTCWSLPDLFFPPPHLLCFLPPAVDINVLKPGFNNVKGICVSCKVWVQLWKSQHIYEMSLSRNLVEVRANCWSSIWKKLWNKEQVLSSCEVGREEEVIVTGQILTPNRQNKESGKEIVCYFKKVENKGNFIVIV